MEFRSLAWSALCVISIVAPFVWEYRASKFRQSLPSEWPPEGYEFPGGRPRRRRSSLRRMGEALVAIGALCGVLVLYPALLGFGRFVPHTLGYALFAGWGFFMAAGFIVQAIASRRSSAPP